MGWPDVLLNGPGISFPDLPLNLADPSSSTTEIRAAAQGITGPVWFYLQLQSQAGVSKQLWWDGMAFEATVQSAAALPGTRDYLPGTSNPTGSWYALMPSGYPKATYYWEAWYGGKAGAGGTLYANGILDLEISGGGVVITGENVRVR